MSYRILLITASKGGLLTSPLWVKRWGNFFPVSKWPRQDSNSCFSDSRTSDLLICTKKLTEISISLIFSKTASLDTTKSLTGLGPSVCHSKPVCHSEPVSCGFCGFHHVPLF